MSRILIAAIVAALAVLVMLVVWWHETHRKCVGADSCRPGEGCTDVGGSKTTYCGKCETGTDCLSAEQYVEANSSGGLTVSVPGCVEGKCESCVSNLDCANNYACNLSGSCNRMCNASANCSLGNCGRTIDGTTTNGDYPGVCASECSSYHDCPNGWQCMSGACAVMEGCSSTSGCSSGFTCKTFGSADYCFDNSGT